MGPGLGWSEIEYETILFNKNIYESASLEKSTYLYDMSIQILPLFHKVHYFI